MQKKTVEGVSLVAGGRFEEALARARAGLQIRPKSLIMTIFGDSIVPRGGVIWLGSIVKLAALFDLDEPLVRTSAFRLVSNGWLTRQPVGKLSYYSMSEAYVAADSAYQSQIYSPGDVLRRNGWTIFRMFGDQLDRKAIYKLRKTLTGSGFGQLAPFVFVHPSIAKSAVRQMMAFNGKDSKIGVAFFAQEIEQTPDMMRHLVSVAWDLAEVRQGYDNFIANFQDLPAILDTETPRPEVAFALRTHMVHQFRRLALRDPRLSTDLFVDGWPGEEAFELISDVYPRLLPASEAYLDMIFQEKDGVVPTANKRLFQRFSGAV